MEVQGTLRPECAMLLQVMNFKTKNFGEMHQTKERSGEMREHT
jgi:hypothetical protein